MSAILTACRGPAAQSREGHARDRWASRQRPPRRPGAQLRGNDGMGGSGILPTRSLRGLGEGRGRPRVTDRAAGPRSVSSGPPHPDSALLPWAARKSQARKPPPPQPPPLPRIALRRRARDVIAPALPRTRLPNLAPPTLAQVSAFVSTARARFFHLSPPRTQLCFCATPLRKILRSPGSKRFGTLALAFPALL